MGVNFRSIAALNRAAATSLNKDKVGADFWEGHEDSNFLAFGVRRFSEWPEPLH